ncbi:MAG: hypothetical protein WAL59_29010 [Roseiarcus sp.]
MEQAFITSVIAEGIEPNSNFPFGQYPADKTVYKNARLVEFETPANKGQARNINSQGFDPDPRHAKLKVWSPGSPDLYLLTVHFSANQAHLASAIIDNAEYAVDGSNGADDGLAGACPPRSAALQSLPRLDIA